MAPMLVCRPAEQEVRIFFLSSWGPSRCLSVSLTVFLLTGQSGLGKSTLMNTLFKSKVSRKSVLATAQEKIPKTIEIKSISHGMEPLHPSTFLCALCFLSVCGSVGQNTLISYFFLSSPTLLLYSLKIFTQTSPTFPSLPTFLQLSKSSLILSLICNMAETDQIHCVQSLPKSAQFQTRQLPWKSSHFHSKMSDRIQVSHV